MPNLWKFKSKTAENAPKIETYDFLETEEMEGFEEEPLPDWSEDEVEAISGAEEPVAEEPQIEEKIPENPLDYAMVQSDLILQAAQKQADQILADAAKRAQEQAEEACAKAQEAGYQAGYQEGLQTGMAKAMEQEASAREAMAQQLEDDVSDFLEKAQRTLDAQLDSNVDELRDLALAVAEKIVCVSLKSSSDVIGRMIQTAIDKRKRCEWVHIYIAECDAKRLTKLPPALASALAELSDRVRIIPMADDEAGTCIIESPNEIIDASASTQMQNLRDVLSNGSTGGMMTDFNFSKRR